MTMLTDVDRLLGSVLEADGPQAVPPGLVEAALVEARATGQRRPLVRLLDPLAWPPLVGPLPRRASRRLATLALVALVVVAAIALAVLVGSPRPPRVLADGQRAFVWLGDRAYQFVGDGSTEHRVTPGRGAGSCPTLIAGTTVIARVGFLGWDLVDVATDTVVGHVTFNIAGREIWSDDGRRMAILDEADRLGIATVDDPAAPELVWYDVPGFQGFDWSRGGDRAAVLSAVGGVQVLQVLDVTTGIRRDVVRPEGTITDVRWSSDGPILIAVAAGPGASTLTMIDPDGGPAIDLPGVGADLVDATAATADGTAIAFGRPSNGIRVMDATGATLGTTVTSEPVRDLAWSASGDRLAFREGDALVVVDRDGTGRRAVSVAPNAVFRWDEATTDLIVASAGAGGVAVERYETASLTPIARLARPPASVVPTPPSSRGFVDEDDVLICLELDEIGPAPPGDS
jgi:hypothetical protein